MAQKSKSVARIPIDLLVFRVVVFGGIADLVFKVIEGGFLRLLARVLLLFVDVFQAEFPKFDVAPKEHNINDAADGRSQSAADHQEPVEEAVGEHGRKQTRPEVGAAFFGMELRHREEIAQHHAEEEMSWY